MALEAAAKKTEHAGAKNSGHDRIAPRADLKDAAKKLRRRADKRAVEAGKQGGVLP